MSTNKILKGQVHVIWYASLPFDSFNPNHNLIMKIQQQNWCYHFLIWLTHWGRVTHICVGNLTIIGSDNGLSHGRCQAITWTNVGILLIGPLGTNFSEMLIGIHTFLFKKIHLKMSSGKWRPFCLGLNVLTTKHFSLGGLLNNYNTTFKSLCFAYVEIFIVILGFSGNSLTRVFQAGNNSQLLSCHKEGYLKKTWVFE